MFSIYMVCAFPPLQIDQSMSYELLNPQHKPVAQPLSSPPEEICVITTSRERSSVKSAFTNLSGMNSTATACVYVRILSLERKVKVGTKTKMTKGKLQRFSFSKGLHSVQAGCIRRIGDNRGSEASNSTSLRRHNDHNVYVYTVLTSKSI